jgi:hypothetical protein
MRGLCKLYVATKSDICRDKYIVSLLDEKGEVIWRVVFIVLLFLRGYVIMPLAILSVEEVLI